MNSQPTRYISNEKSIYESCFQQQPDLVKDIEVLVQRGHSPTDIENFVRLVAAQDSPLAHHMYWVASYILRQQISQN